jgi:hypothetical protein
MTSTIALVTCTDIPDLEPDDRLLIPALDALGLASEIVVWDDPTVDWARYDLTVLRSPWDYAARHDEFVAWAAGVPRLANDAATVTWNTDKRYLATLADAGVAIVPTAWIEPAQAWPAPDGGEWVIKPTISAGSKDTGRYDMADAAHRGHAKVHLDRLSTDGRTTMIQPYLDAVDTYGETALIYFDGRFSHAIRKGPMLDGPDLGVVGLYKPEAITAREPSPAEHALADRVLDAIPARFGSLLYARVDLIPGPDGTPRLVELELTEPSLFLEFGDGSADRLAAAIAARLV